jgi:signal transduction histidine kinase
VADEKLFLTVSDRGIGVPSAELNTIFDKFIQSSKAKSGAGRTGLGLAICRGIVEAHGGSIHAEGRNGEARHSVLLSR